MRANHTPGPWEVTWGDGWAEIGADDGHGTFAKVHLRDSKTNNTEELAGNIRVMALAPMLLLKCQQAVEMLETIGNLDVRFKPAMLIADMKDVIREAGGK